MWQEPCSQCLGVSHVKLVTGTPLASGSSCSWDIMVICWQRCIVTSTYISQLTYGPEPTHGKVNMCVRVNMCWTITYQNKYVLKSVHWQDRHVRINICVKIYMCQNGRTPQNSVKINTHLFLRVCQNWRSQGPAFASNWRIGINKRVRIDTRVTVDVYVPKLTCHNRHTFQIDTRFTNDKCR